MKRSLPLIMLIVFINALTFSAFSFTVDGKDNGVEWDGATVYKLIDGESNCGVNFGLVKVKFDYDTDAVCLCFLFIDPELTPDNGSAGISLTVEDSSSFEIVASETSSYMNIDPYSFEGAIYLDENNGATCEIRVGIKSGLPETVDFDARFIDSHGYYSDYQHFVVVNEMYEETVPMIIQPTADNPDPAYNSDLLTETTEKTTRNKTTKASTTKKTTTRKSTTNRTTTEFYIKTSPPYTNSHRTTAVRKTEPEKTTAETTKIKTTKAAKTEKVKEKIYYYEKEIYISEVYVTQSTEPCTTLITELSTDKTEYTEISTSSAASVTLSEGTKYKKILAAVSLAAFILIAFFGTYSARKSKKFPENKE